MVTVAAVKPVCVCSVIELGLSNSVSSGIPSNFSNIGLPQIHHLRSLLYKRTALAEAGFPWVLSLGGNVSPSRDGCFKIQQMDRG